MGTSTKFIEKKGITKVYEKDTYIVFVSDMGLKYILYNTEKDFVGGHTHLNSLKMAKTIIANCISKKKPNTDNMYIMVSHMRVSSDKGYIDFIDDLIAVKMSKGLKPYYNSKGRRFR